MNRTIRAAVASTMGLISVLGTSVSGMARPIVPAERRLQSFSGHVTSCDNRAVLDSITERFQIRERYWSSGLLMTGFDEIAERGYRTDGYDYVPRRYCEARVAFNDQKYRRIDYWIGEDQGFAGYGFGVEWCVVGLDRNYAFTPACRAAGP
jgi:hypothetical protein